MPSCHVPFSPIPSLSVSLLQLLIQCSCECIAAAVTATSSGGSSTERGRQARAGRALSGLLVSLRTLQATLARSSQGVASSKQTAEEQRPGSGTLMVR